MGTTTQARMIDRWKANKQIQMHWFDCTTCDGAGFLPQRNPCPECSGVGKVHVGVIVPRKVPMPRIRFWQIVLLAAIASGVALLVLHNMFPQYF